MLQPGQGSGRNGDYYLFHPSGVPADASMFVDFVGQRAWRGMVEPMVFAEAFSCVRASTGLGQELDGDWVSFAADVARITDRGVRVEPASTNYIRNNTNVGQIGTGLPTNWAVTPNGGLATEVLGKGTKYGLSYTRVRVFGTASGVQYMLAFEPTTGIAAALGQAWTLSAFVELVAAPSAPNSYNLRTQECLGASVLNNNNQSFVPDASWQQFSFTRTTSEATVTSIRPGLGLAFTDGAAVDVTLDIFPQMEIAASATSPIFTAGATASRAAEAVTIDLPPGIHDVVFILDDDSTQTIAGQSGEYVIPTNLNRRVIKSVKAVSA